MTIAKKGVAGFIVVKLNPINTNVIILTDAFNNTEPALIRRALTLFGERL